MPRPRKSTADAPGLNGTEIVPVEANTALSRLRRRRVGPKTLDKFLKQVHCAFAPWILPKLYIDLIYLNAGPPDRENLKLTAQVYGVIAAGNGPSVTNNIIQGQIMAPPTEGTGQYSYESVVRKLQDTSTSDAIDVQAEEASSS